MESTQAINMETDLICHLVKIGELEEKYGHRSCLEVSQPYEEMAKLQDKVRELAKKLSNSIDGISEQSLLKVYEDIALDARNIYHLTSDEILSLIENGDIRFQVMDIHDFLDEYVDEEHTERFRSLLWYIDPKTRTEFLKENYLCDWDVYFTPDLSYLVLFECDLVNEKNM